MIELHTLGGIDLRDAAGASLDDLLRQPKRVALLVYLVLAEPSGLQRRDMLLALFWPELDAARARAALRKSLYVLRAALGPDVITTRGDDEVGVNAEQLRCDALELTAALGEGRLAEALERYRGDLLAGFHVSEVSPELEQWLDARREELRGRAVAAAWRYSAELADAGRLAEARRWARWANGLAPDDENGVRRLLELLGRMGDRAGAMQVYEEFRERLRREYDVLPAPETQALVAAIGSREARQSWDAPVTSSPPASRPALATPPAPVSILRRPWRKAFVGAVGLGALAVVAALVHRTPATPLRADQVAVAPFTVLSPASSLTLWQEGMVDLLARNLDGAGPLTSVPPGQVIRSWRGHGAGAEAAVRLGRSTGAGLVVYGSLLGLVGDSARVSATVLDVTTGRSLGDVEIRGSLDRMDVVVDSLTRELLRRIQSVRQLASARFTGIGSRSVPALKAFLKGEQFRRRAAWDSVVAYDLEATRLDSTFALAWLRLGEAYAEIQFPVPLVSGPEPDNPWYLIYRAGTLNRGLTRHDSLEVAVGAGVAAFVLGQVPSAAERPQAERVFKAALDGTRLYPDDAEAWFSVALVQDFLGDLIHTTNAQTYASYSRAIALDSGFAPAYRMALRISGDAGDVSGTRRLAVGYLGLAPTASRQIPLLIAGLLDSRTDSASAQRLVESMPNVILWPALTAIWLLPDSGEAALRIARVMAAREPDPRYWFTSTWITRRNLAAVLAYRGHLREAFALGGEEQSTWFPNFFPELAMLGAVPAARADSVFNRWWALPGDTLGLPYVRWWWASQGNLTALRRMPRYWPGDTAAVAAAWDLARGDTAQALREFAAWRRTGGSGYFALLTFVRLLAAKGNVSQALTILNGREPNDWPIPSHVVWTLERARLSWLAGDRAAAARDYEFVAGIWRQADPALQPFVAEARDALRRLAAEEPLNDGPVRARLGLPGPGWAGPEGRVR